jgi:hypothetical protein
MMPNDRQVDLTDLADGTLSGLEWDAWLAAHPEAAAEIEVARRVRSLVSELRGVLIDVPANFEARLLERVREDESLLDLLDLGLGGLGRALLELLELCLSFVPGPQPAFA